MAQYSHEDVLALWQQGDVKDKPRYNGTHVFVEGADAFSYGHHFLLGRRIHSSCFLINTHNYSVSTSKQQSIMRRVLRHLINQNHVISFSASGHNNWWDSPTGLPAVGNIIQSNSLEVLKGSTALDLYDKYLDANTGGIKYGLWGGDFDKLVSILGEPDPYRYVWDASNQAALIFLETEGLAPALEIIKSKGLEINHTMASAMVAAGATSIEGVGKLRGWYWETWRQIQNSGGPEEQYVAASNIYIKRQRLPDRQAATDFLNNLNRRAA